MSDSPELDYVSARFNAPLDDEWRNVETAWSFETSFLNLTLATHALWCGVRAKSRAAVGLRISILHAEPLVRLSEEAMAVPALIEEARIVDVQFGLKPPRLLAAGTSLRIEVRRGDVLPIDEVRVGIYGFELRESQLASAEEAIRKFGDTGWQKVYETIRGG